MYFSHNIPGPEQPQTRPLLGAAPLRQQLEGVNGGGRKPTARAKRFCHTPTPRLQSLVRQEATRAGAAKMIDHRQRRIARTRPMQQPCYQRVWKGRRTGVYAENHT